MNLHKRTLYNLVQLNLVPSLPKDLQLEDWQKENYREYSKERLLEELGNLGIPYKNGDFEAYAQNFDTPEEAADSVTQGMPPLDGDHVYLLFFELWRRQFPEKQSLSIFGDELDHLILEYKKDPSSPTQALHDAIENLQTILEKNIDVGLPPQNALMMMQSFCAHNLENFLFTFASDRIDEGEITYAKELIECISRYTPNTYWFEYLSARIEIQEDPIEGYSKLERIFQRADLPLSFNIEVMAFLATTGNHSLFTTLAMKTLPLLKNEQDFRDIAIICYHHFAYLELDALASQIEELMTKRPQIEPQTPFSSGDPDLMELRKILRQKVHFVTERNLSK